MEHQEKLVQILDWSLVRRDVFALTRKRRWSV